MTGRPIMGSDRPCPLLTAWPPRLNEGGLIKGGDTRPPELVPCPECDDYRIRSLRHLSCLPGRPRMTSIDTNEPADR